MNFSNRYRWMLCCVLLAVTGRVLPHPPNVTPTVALAFLMPVTIGLGPALIVNACSMMLANVLLGWFWHWPMWGSFSLSSYAALSLISLLGCRVTTCRLGRTLAQLTGATVSYWLITNAAVWLSGGLYPATLAGLGQCYLMALPFLQASFLGDWSWFMLLVGLMSFAKNQNLLWRDDIMQRHIVR